MSEIMKIIDKRETQTKKTKTEKNKGDKSYIERVRAKWSWWAFKSDFFRLICKELALSIISKERELCESKHVAVECKCSKTWDLWSFWYVPQS